VGESFQEGENNVFCHYLLYPTSDTELCEVVTKNLGMCDDPPQDRCTNPGSYGDKTSCEAALCKWDQPTAGGPYECVFPQ